jgi:hypothetical protein
MDPHTMIHTFTPRLHQPCDIPRARVVCDAFETRIHRGSGSDERVPSEIVTVRSNVVLIYEVLFLRNAVHFIIRVST